MTHSSDLSLSNRRVT